MNDFNSIFNQCLERIHLSKTKAEMVYDMLTTTENVGGALADLGAFRGGVGMLMKLTFPTKDLLSIDTFEGIPVKDEIDVHTVGEFGETSYEEVKSAFKGISGVQIIKGTFPQCLKDNKIPDRYSFIFLDFDQYQATKDALIYFLDRVSPGGLLMLDDFGWEACPGVERAVEELGITVEKLKNNLAVIERL